MRAHPLRCALLLLGGSWLLSGLSPVRAESETGSAESFERNILQVAERWKNRVFLVVADAGPARVPIERVLENPKVLFRKRRVGCAIYTAEGRFFLTTASVVGDSPEVEIFDEEGRHVLARIVGKDEHLDLAVLESLGNLPDTEGLPPLEAGEPPRSGTPCIVLGNAYGQSLSATLGVLGEMLEIDPGGLPVHVRRVSAPIFPGDSGGPVLDAEGRFLGIVTAAWCPTRSSAVLEGSVGEIELHGRPTRPAAMQGLVVPAEACERAWQDLRHFGRVRRGFLGVEIAVAEEGRVGARILSVLPDSPAHRGGIRPGDVITMFGRHVVTGPSQLCALVAGSSPHLSMEIQYLRDDDEYLSTVELGDAVTLPGKRRLRSAPAPDPAVRSTIIPTDAPSK